jgi:hypothetical protein
MVWLQRGRDLVAAYRLAVEINCPISDSCVEINWRISAS